LPTGKVLVSGGHGGGGGLDSTELYDPDTNAFTAGASLNQARQSHSARVLPNGLVLVAGGNNNTSGDWDIQTNFLSSAELYDPEKDTFTMTGSKNIAASAGNALLVWTGKLLAAGGGTKDAELYTPEMPGTPEIWVPAADMLTPRSGHRWNLLGNGTVLMTGGLDSAGNPLGSAELYDYRTGDFSSTGNMTIARQQHRTVRLYTGKVLVTGGRPHAISNVLNSAELYDPGSGTFASTGNMRQYRRLHRSTELPNGKILITGGLGGTSNTANGILAMAELYDPATGVFTQTTGSMTTARRNHQMILLPTGKVLIAGGFGAGGVLLKSAELYDPATNTFKATGNMITARSPLLTRLPNGKILASNGSDEGGTPIQTLEIYDPKTGTFKAAGKALVARDGNKVSRLGNGKSILVGGQTTADAASVTNSAELYDDENGSLSFTGGLITGRQDFAQEILPNGRILVAGGLDSNGTVLSSAELYTPLITAKLDTIITSNPAVLTNSTTANFTFTSTMAGSTFKCSLDNAAFATCTSPKSYPRLKDGNHNFKVQAIAEGNTDPTPANFDWTIDAKAPNTTITSSPSKLTNNPRAAFSFTSTETDSTFECSIDGSLFAPCSSPWTSGVLIDGKHAFQVRATDAAGNLDKSAAKAKQWTVDTIPPDTIITMTPKIPTSSTSAKFSFKSTEARSTFQCALDGAGFTPCKSGQ